MELSTGKSRHDKSSRGYGANDGRGGGGGFRGNRSGGGGGYGVSPPRGGDRRRGGGGGGGDGPGYRGAPPGERRYDDRNYPRHRAYSR